MFHRLYLVFENLAKREGEKIENKSIKIDLKQINCFYILFQTYFIYFLPLYKIGLLKINTNFNL